MPADRRLPEHADLVAELRLLRERGLTGIRGAALPGLALAARLTGTGFEAVPEPAGIEQLIRLAIGRLGGGDLGRAAEQTFGTPPGLRGVPAVDRRRNAARVYHVSAERFRKAQERTIIAEVAEMILELCSRRAVAAADAEAGQSPAAMSGTSPLGRWTRELRLDRRDTTVTLHVGPVELLRDIDVVVSSTNVYFELSYSFRSSLSAALQNAAAVRAPETGAVQDDVVRRELADWLTRNGCRGLAVAPGTVAVTSSGQLAQRGIRRIFHAAVATPLISTKNHLVELSVIPLAVRNVFQAAWQERRGPLPGLSSICFPLFGAGCGALSRQQSLACILAALSAELTDGDPWQLHLLSRGAAQLDLTGWMRAG